MADHRGAHRDEIFVRIGRLEASGKGTVATLVVAVIVVAVLVAVGTMHWPFLP